MKVSAKLLVMIPAFVLIGCGNFNSIHRDLDISKGRGAIVDVKQRAIIVDTQIAPNGTDTPSNGAVAVRSVCAEPSPDALSAYAAEIAANLSKQGVGELGLALATQESASFIGLRTQTIQLLRDGMYRLCEARMNGVSTENYAHLMRRYQRNMVALMAIEQLSGVVKAPTVTISTESQASAAQSINSLRKASDEVAASISSKNKRIAELGEGKNDEEKEEIKNLNSEVTELTADKKSIDDAIKNARGLTAGGTVTANVVVPSTAAQERVGGDIAAKIEALSKEILKQDDMPFLCYEHLRTHKLEQGKTLTMTNGKIEASGSANLTPKDALAIRCVDIIAPQPATLQESIDVINSMEGWEASPAQKQTLIDIIIRKLSGNAQVMKVEKDEK